MTSTKFFVVPSPGHYGDRSRVYSSHATLGAAKRAAGSDGSRCVRVGGKVRGDEWLRVYEETYPIATRADSSRAGINRTLAPAKDHRGDPCIQCVDADGRVSVTDLDGEEYDAKEWTLTGDPIPQDGDDITEWDWQTVVEAARKAVSADQTGWVACDYTDGDCLVDVRHGQIRGDYDRAAADARDGQYQGVRYVSDDGYLYVERPEERS